MVTQSFSKSHLNEASPRGRLNAPNPHGLKLHRYLDRGECSAEPERCEFYRKSAQTVNAPEIAMNRPDIPRLTENNRRTGFLAGVEREHLAVSCAAEGLWMRAWFECAVTLGWRISELLNLKSKQLDLADRSIRLHPGDTKNGEGRLAFLTDKAFVLIKACAMEKHRISSCLLGVMASPSRIFGEPGKRQQTRQEWVACLYTICDEQVFGT